MSTFLDPKLIGTGFVGNLNMALEFLWALGVAWAVIECFIVDTIVTCVAHVLLRRRRRLYGDERVWIKDLLAATGHPGLAPSGEGRHRRPPQRHTFRENLEIYVGIPQTLRLPKVSFRRAPSRPPRHAVRRGNGGRLVAGGPQSPRPSSRPGPGPSTTGAATDRRTSSRGSRHVHP